jgi:hypothetical protein
MKNKADFLLGEFGVKMIMAILCIIVLLGIALYLSGLFTTQSRQKQAEATLENVNNEIKLLSDSNLRIDYTLKSPQDWYFFSALGVLNNDASPYLCICPVNNVQSCVQGGVCIKTESLIILDASMQGAKIAHTSAENLVISKKDGKVYLSKEQ